MSGDRVWPGVSMKEVAQVCPPSASAFVWTEPACQSSGPPYPLGAKRQQVTAASPGPPLTASWLGREAPGEGVGAGTRRWEEDFSEYRKGSRAPATAGGRGALEGDLPFGNRKTQTQTRAEGWGGPPPSTGMPGLGWDGPGGTLRNVLSESH